MRFFCLFSFVLFIFTETVYAETDPRIAELCQGSIHLKKLSSGLLKMRLAFENGENAQQVMEKFAPFAIRDGKIQCIIGVKTISPSLLSACAQANLTICNTSSFNNLFQIVVRCSDPHQFDSLAQLPEVLGVAFEPCAAHMRVTVDNEANHSIHASEAREKYGVDGSNTRIGVLSDSIADISKQSRIFDGFILGTPSQANKELPIKIRVLDLGDGTGSDEGSAMMELIHDIAPGADFSFASVQYNYSAFSQNIQKLYTDPGYECDILVDDISFLNEPIYQHGPIALAAMEAVANGVPYFSAAGNFNRNAHERPFTPVSSETISSYPPDGKSFHDFGAAYGKASDTHLTVHMKRYSTIMLALHWDEPYGGILASGPGAQSDLDLYLVSNVTKPLREGTNGNILASSIDIQGTENDPSGEPIEFIYFTNTEKDQDVHVVINHQKGLIPKRLHLFIVFEEADGNYLVDKQFVQDRTLIGHMSAPGVTAVAAIPFREIDTNGEYIEPIEQLNVAEYSAFGGILPILFSDDGMERYQTPQYVIKPDLSGPDNTSTSVPGFETFSGTSAAASNVAGIAALMLQLDSTLTPGKLISAMQQSSIDLENPGLDYRAGWGLVDAYRALQAISPSFIPVFNNY